MSKDNYVDVFNNVKQLKIRNTAYSYRNKSLLTKAGSTRVLKESEIARMMYKGIVHKGDIVVKFKTDAEGLRLAKKYAKLANNPSIQMNVTFMKV